MKKVYLIAVVAALIAGFATYLFANQINEKTTIKDKATETVYVATEDIPANTEITADMFAEGSAKFVTKAIVVDYVTPNAVTKQSDLVGKITLDTLYANEQINSSRLQSKDGEDVALSFKLPKGRVAYSINAASVKSVDGYVSEGDTVDFIVYDRTKGTTKVAYKGLKVLRVSNNTANTSATSTDAKITDYSTLTFDVTEKQALQLYKYETNYDFKLVLNPRA